MNNLMKSDFYKLLKSKYLYICGGICLGFSVISIVILNLSNEIMAATDATLYINGEEMFGGYAYSFSNTINTAFDTSIILFIAIIVSIFVSSEFGFGTIKNSASKAFTRTQIYLSKWFTSVIVANVLMILFVAVYGVLALIFWGFGTPADGFWLEFIKLFALQIVLNTAFTSIFVMVGMIMKQGGTIPVNICIIMFGSTITMLIDFILTKITGKTVETTSYLLSSIMNEVTNAGSIAGGLVTKALVIAVIYLVVTIGLGITTFNKQDIK